MRRYIVLLLITGIVWAQTDFDKLVLKDGTEHLGEYSKIKGMKGKKVYFRHQDALAFQPVPVKLIKKLQLKDGQIIIPRGYLKNIYSKNNKHTSAFEEYQKLSINKKAIYDANLYNVNNWRLYMPMSTVFFGGFASLYSSHFIPLEGEFQESFIFLGGSSAASLAIPYFILNINEKFNFPKSILTESEKEIYKQAYSKKLKKRKFEYAVGTAIFIGLIVAVAVIVLDDIKIFSGPSIDFGPGTI